jgi:hypothetical protein
MKTTLGPSQYIMQFDPITVGKMFLASMSVPAENKPPIQEIVLRRFEDRLHPFVIHQHWIASGDHNGFCQPRYFDDEEAAREDFLKACREMWLIK